MTDSPPTVAEFNRQIVSLMRQLGTQAFCAQPDKKPDYTLFIDGDQVVAEPKGAPRYPYGLYHTIDSGLSDTDIGHHVDRWLASGEAYQEFLAMNVCRYNC
ncbi:hypothetical protein D5085_00425 [Ectothiorhodospiraceae bacterium BW-2]|nr:hypothetical protein D5085_00425 [Ectothiorhodospiraceae bacterium BW-2]